MAHRLISALALGVASTMAVSTVSAQEVNIYSARHYDSDMALYNSFTEQTGIKVNIIEGDSDQLIQRIKSEGIASPADILMTVDAGRLWRGEDEGIFQSVNSDVLDSRLPENMRHPEGLWFGFSQRVRAIYFNRESFDPSQVSSYEDLASADFPGDICIRSSSNIYNQSLLASMIEHHGAEEAEAWAAGIVSNMARTPQGGDTDQILGAAAGECDVAVANHYYYVRLLKSEDPAQREAARKVGILFPNQSDRGIHTNVGGAGVVATAPNRDEAVRFLEFLASDEAQQLFAFGNNEFPVVEGVFKDPILESWGNFKIDDLNISALGFNNPEAIRIFDRVNWR